MTLVVVSSSFPRKFLSFVLGICSTCPLTFVGFLDRKTNWTYLKKIVFVIALEYLINCWLCLCVLWSFKSCFERSGALLDFLYWSISQSCTYSELRHIYYVSNYIYILTSALPSVAYWRRYHRVVQYRTSNGLSFTRFFSTRITSSYRAIIKKLQLCISWISFDYFACLHSRYTQRKSENSLPWHKHIHHNISSETEHTIPKWFIDCFFLRCNRLIITQVQTNCIR